MAIEMRTLSGKNPRLKINLTELFGQRTPDSDSFRASVGQAIIDQIRKNADSSKDRNGKPYTGRPARYSKQYKNSQEFKAANKSSAVNLKLTGDMLGLMDIIDQTRNTITIGFPTRQEQLKAHGHILGSDPGPRVKRDFFGLPPKEYESITKKFTLNTSTEESQSTLANLTTLRNLFRDAG